MKKLFFYSLFAVSVLTSCNKDKEPTPNANVEGKWNLSTAQIAIKLITGDETDETLDYKSMGVYMELKSGNKFSTNLVLAEDLNDFLTLGDPYESDYEVSGDEITLKIYDDVYEDYLPVKLKIQSTTESEMVFQFTKAELAGLMKAYDELDGTNENSQMLAFITSLNAVLTFNK